MMAFIQNKGLSLISKNVSRSHQIQSRENSSQGAEMPQEETSNIKYTELHCIMESLPWMSQSLPPHDGSLQNTDKNRISCTK